MTQGGDVGNPSVAARKAARHYELLTREAPVLSHLHMDRDGIDVDDQGLAWHCDGDVHSSNFTDIDSIRLQFGALPESGPLCTCEITFGDGLLVYVYSAVTYGEAPNARAAAYRDFLRDLHGRLAAADRARIRFLAGDTARKRMFGEITLVVASLFFVVTPLVMLAVLREWSMLGAVSFGFGLVVPLYHVLARNKPRTYDPARIPDDVMP